MLFKKVQIIINPASIKEEPILFYLNQTFENTGIEWKVTVLNKGHDIIKKVKKLMDKADLFVVYGGDGTVSSVAQALIGSNIPMAIIPAGTANIIAKELNIPLDTQAAIQLLMGAYEIKKIDTGTMNGIPFVIRVNFGIMAKMVTEANRELKNNLGQLAYGLTAFQTINSVLPEHFKLTIDGEKMETNGVALTVTNLGNVGAEGFSFLPDIWNDDGLLDVLFLEQASTLNMMKYVGTTLFQTDSNVLKRWKCKEIKIELNREEAFICDDCEMMATSIQIKIVPKSLKVLVPQSIDNLQSLSNE